jgi:hypothetical protein
MFRLGSEERGDRLSPGDQIGSSKPMGGAWLEHATSCL